MTNPADLSIPDAAARLRTGTLTSERLTQAHLERIARLDPEIHAFVAIDPDAAMAAAASADAAFEQGLDLGPLHGIPIAAKDLIDVAGLPTLCGSRLRSGHVATDDAEIVRRLRDAGAIPLGKLATYEFALVGPSFDGPSPPPLNPRSPGHITGGSSSGAAAAVAAGLLRTAIGTDTGGSLRSPAGYCGVVGLKPTFGRVSRRGVFPLSPSLDHVGPVAASVAEAALTFDAIADEGPKASARLGQDIAGLRIAYARNWFARDPELTPELLQAMDAAVGGLARLGALIDEVELPDYAVMEAAGAVILHAEALAVHRATLAGTGAGYGRQAWQSLLSGLCLTPADLAAAHRAAACLRAAIDSEVFARHDALVTVNTLTPAPPVAAFAGDTPVWTPMRTLPFNLTGHPALAVPVGAVGGLPAGMQIVGRFNDEAGICCIGNRLGTGGAGGGQQPV